MLGIVQAGATNTLIWLDNFIHTVNVCEVWKAYANIGPCCKSVKHVLRVFLRFKKPLGSSHCWNETKPYVCHDNQLNYSLSLRNPQKREFVRFICIILNLYILYTFSIINHGPSSSFIDETTLATLRVASASLGANLIQGF